MLWQDEATRAIPKVKRHAKSSHANPTPVTDGQRVIASFGGEGIYAYSMDGELLWTYSLVCSTAVGSTIQPTNGDLEVHHSFLKTW